MVIISKILLDPVNVHCTGGINVFNHWIDMLNSKRAALSPANFNCIAFIRDNYKCPQAYTAC
jgi:hypothetical protein